jgi:hypothetical protein
MKQLHFFALPEDHSALLSEIEIRKSLKFVRMDIRGDEDEFQYDSSQDLPNLGHASNESSIACETYLVCEPTTNVVTRRVLRTDGRQVKCVDQLVNPDSVTFTPGGTWNNDIVVAGRIATASDSAISKALMRSFQEGLKKTFNKVKGYYVGPKAMEYLKAGKRLTAAVQSPQEYDLTTGGTQSGHL